LKLRGIQQFGEELAAIARNKKVLIAVIAVLAIPVLYTAMFLTAFWDPYAKLADLPVAIVNEDKGTEFNGEKMQIGADFEEQLKKNPKFNWVFVSMEEAEKGLADNSYYMAIEIPADFSEKTTSLTSDKPMPAQLKYVPNEGYNFLASQIGNTAIDQLKSLLNKEVTSAYTRTVFEQMEQLVDGIGQASDGAGEIADGTTKAKDGAVLIQQNLSKLVSGSLTLKEGVGKLDAGGQKLASGSSELNSGAANLASGLGQLGTAQKQLGDAAASLGEGVKSVGTGAEKLSAGLTELSGAGGQLATSATGAQQAAGQLAGGLDAAAAGTAELEAGAAKLAKGLEQLAQSDSKLAQDANFSALLAASKQLEAGLAKSSEAQQQLNGGASKLNEGLVKLSAGLGTFDAKLKEAATAGNQLGAGGKQLVDGANKFTSGMQQFGVKFSEASAGGTKLAAGAKQLNSGVSELTSGLGQLSTSIVPFVDGSTQLEDGAQQVASGLLKLDEGTHELSGKLSDASDKTAGLELTDDMVDMFADPIKLDVERINEVPNYGTGFAPYFLSLGLFVGALLITIVYPVRIPAIRPPNAWSWFASKALTLVLIGTIQALIADAALFFILHLEVQSVPLFIMYSILTSIAFMMLVQFFVATLGDPGRFVAIVVLIFQLTTSAGTFPLELIPNWLQKVTPWLPMTYTVAGFKDVISTGDFDSMWKYAALLAGYAVLFAALTLTFFIVTHRKEANAEGTAAPTMS